MNIIKLYQDFNVPYAAPGQRHYRHGWINIPCPFCYGSGRPGNHLGYCLDLRSSFYGRFICWRCGGKKAVDVLIKLLKVPENEARNILTTYGGSSYLPPPQKPKPAKIIRGIPLPPGTKPLFGLKGACRYLEKRGFDPKLLAEEWGVEAAGPGAGVELQGGRKLDLSYRIVVPIIWKGKVVSWQCRDWTGKSKLKYITCPKELESVFHKEILYGMDLADGLKKGRLVEGVTDVWSLGAGAVACFGIKYREPQVRLLAERFEEVDLVLDPEPAAKLQARRIKTALEDRGVLVRNVALPKGKDPADLSEEERKEVMLG